MEPNWCLESASVFGIAHFHYCHDFATDFVLNMQVEVAGFIDQFRPGNSRARREWAGGAPPTVHELGLKQDGSDVADSSLVTSSAETSVLRQASDRSIIPAPTAVSTAVKVLKHTLGHSVSAWRDTSKVSFFLAFILRLRLLFSDTICSHFDSGFADDAYCTRANLHV
jgi:hypothetical protein